jgi:hypothetical protein
VRTQEEVIAVVNGLSDELLEQGLTAIVAVAEVGGPWHVRCCGDQLTALGLSSQVGHAADMLVVANIESLTRG